MSEEAKTARIELNEEESSQIYCILSEIKFNEQELRDICSSLQYDYKGVVKLLGRIQNELDAVYNWLDS